MLFNVGKCKVMDLGRANTNKDYYMNSKKLENTSMEKDLGVIITSNLKSSQQCSQSYAKASRILGMIKRTIPTNLQIYCCSCINHCSDLT